MVGSTVYLPCLSGTIAVQASASPPALRLLWRAPVGGGPPIVAAGLVWTIGQDGRLYGLDPSTGAVRQHATIGAPANHFPTPSVGAGLMLAPTAERVVAFAAPSPDATPASSTTTTTAPHPTTTAPATTTSAPAAGAGTSGWVIAGAVGGGLVVAAGLIWLLLRRRRAGGQ